MPRFIILELLAGGDLKTFLRNNRPRRVGGMTDIYDWLTGWQKYMTDWLYVNQSLNDWNLQKTAVLTVWLIDLFAGPPSQPVNDWSAVHVAGCGSRMPVPGRQPLHPPWHCCQKLSAHHQRGRQSRQDRRLRHGQRYLSVGDQNLKCNLNLPKSI